jgi:hypothetical protein
MPPGRAVSYKDLMVTADQVESLVWSQVDGDDSARIAVGGEGIAA